MNIFKLANVIDKKLSPLQIESNLCTRVISPKSKCNSCVEHCPTNSIRFNKTEVIIDENCIECGICTTVCPTNAILTQRPSLNQLISDTISRCKQNERVYLHCEKVNVTNHDVVSVKIPCLGALPREAWLALSSECGENLDIYHPDESCKQCEVSSGENVWQTELQIGQNMSSVQLRIATIIEQPNQQVHYDQNRRAFFSTLFSEVKSTNKLALKEWFASDSVQSYKDKVNEDPVLRLEKEWQGLANGVVEKITHESSYPYMYKRNIFLAELSKNETLQKRCDVRLPTILPDCTLCGACALLCPTDALVLDRSNGHETITLHPSKCVDCKLCEEICFFETITLVNVANSSLLSEPTVLVENK